MDATTLWALIGIGVVGALFGPYLTLQWLRRDDERKERREQLERLKRQFPHLDINDDYRRWS